MIVSTQITSTVIFVFADFLVSKLLRGKVLFINRKEKTVKTVKKQATLGRLRFKKRENYCKIWNAKFSGYL